MGFKPHEKDLVISLGELLELTRENPELTFTADKRVHYFAFEEPGVDWFLAEGKEARRLGVPEDTWVPRYSAFTDFIGRELVIWQYEANTWNAAVNGEHARQMHVFVGPTSTGKSTFELVKQGKLEGIYVPILDPYNNGEGCPNHDSAFWLLPRSKRDEIQEEFNIRVDRWADICMVCHKAFTDASWIKDEEAREQWLKDHPTKDPENPENARWRHFPVTFKKMGERNNFGIAIVFPMGRFTADEQKLIGGIKPSSFGDPNLEEGDPETLSFHGAASRGNLGVMEFREYYKLLAHPEIMEKLIFLTQEKRVSGPGNYGVVSNDSHKTGHSNFPDFDAFMDDPQAKEQNFSRQATYFWRHLLALTYEVQLYERELQKPEYGREGHFAPHMLSTVARFIIGTRIDEGGSEARQARDWHVHDLIQGYDGENPRWGFAELTEDCPSDGMQGFDARVPIKAIGTAYGRDVLDVGVDRDGRPIILSKNVPAEDRCVIWPEVRPELWEYCHAMIFEQDERKRLGHLIRYADWQYRIALKEELIIVLFPDFQDAAQAFFSDYIERVHIWSDFMNDESEPSDAAAALASAAGNLLQDDEAILGIGFSDRDAFREMVAQLDKDGTLLDWRSDDEVAKRIQKYLEYLIAESDEEIPDDLADKLLRMYPDDYCERCARKTIEHATSDPERWKNIIQTNDKPS